DEQDTWMSLAHSSDELDPIFPPWFLARPGSPRSLEDGIHHEHGHIASHPVALLGNCEHRAEGSLAQCGTECVELGHIRPRREIGIPAVRKNSAACLKEFTRLARHVGGRALNEILRMIHDPRMVGRDVVRHKIQDYAHATIAQFFSGCRQPVGSAKLIVYYVATDTVR